MSSFDGPDRGASRNPGRVSRAAFAAAALAAVLFFAPVIPALTLRARARSFPPAFPFAIGPALSREGFELSYTHSVNKGRVTDFFDIAPSGALVVRKSRFVSYGAGMGEPLEGGSFVDRGSFFELTGLDRSMPRVLLAVGEIAGHAITRAGRRYVLSNLFAPRSSVIIEYRSVSAFDLLRSGLHRR